MYYEERGQGPALLFLHGLGHDHDMWNPQAEYFSETHRVITMDVRGSGRSPALGGWSDVLGRQAVDMRLLLDRAGVERAVVLGENLGGVLAQQFALDYPERVAGLVLADTFSEARAVENLRTVFTKLGAWAALPAVMCLPRRTLARATSRQYARWPLARGQQVWSMLRLRRLDTAKIRAALNHVTLTDQLSEVTCPALCLAGDQPAVLARLVGQLAAALPDARVRTIDDCAYPSNLCQPEVFNEEVAGFLQEIGWVGDRTLTGRPPVSVQRHDDG